MEEEIVRCWKCAFKSVKSQLYKSKGWCPNGKVDMDGKYDENVLGCDTLLSKSIKDEISPPVTP